MKNSTLAAFCVLVLASPTLASDPRDSVVKIYAEQRYPDYQVPWGAGTQFSVTGSGVVIDGGRILTNAHIVSNQTFVQVRRHGQSDKHTAQVVAVSHEADLAILTLDDDAFFDGISAPPLGDLPEVQDRVAVYGFPMGGDTLSATEGVVSRVEHQTYAHSASSLLAVQIDAAINPGNSGGPVIADQKLVGVVMQAAQDANSIGYFVPTPVIRHFLEDIDDGKVDGIPFAGFLWQALESESLREFVQFPERGTGVLITRVVPFTPASRNLRPRDVLTAIDGHGIAFDGTIELRPNLRTSMTHYVQQHQMGEQLRLTVFRDGRTEDLEICLDVPLSAAQLVAPYQYDVQPTYFIYGGLVFNPLTTNYLLSFGPNPPPHLAVFQNGDRSQPGEQVVVLNRVLPSAVNAGYHDWQDRVLTKVNGQQFRGLQEFVHLLETETNPLVVFENDEGQTIVLDRTRAETERETLLRTYGIAADRSQDLVNPTPMAFHANEQK